MFCKLSKESDMKSISFLVVLSLLGTSLAVPRHGTKIHKNFKASATNDYSDSMGGYYELEAKADEPQYGALTAVVESDAEIAAGSPTSSGAQFPPDVPSAANACGWKKVAYLDMSDPTQQCPSSWTKFSSPRASCGKKTPSSCDSLAVATSGVSYQTVCGRFRGYQFGTPDAFGRCGGKPPNTIEDPYVDGISITYGSPGKRQHIFSYAAGVYEAYDAATPCRCPCAGGAASPSFVDTDYYCESGNPNSNLVGDNMYFCDILWDGQQCGPLETACCTPKNLPWFCKTFSAPISGDMEVRMCTDEALDNENVALEFMELYIK